jgi:nitrite reductase/ring-hydroxylating ferredoxin subunit
MTDNTFTFAGAQLKPGERRQVKVNNRDVAIFHIKNDGYYAIDNVHLTNF